MLRGRRTKFSIPAEPDDTDLLLSAYLEQQRAEVSSLESQLKESAGLVEYWNKSYWEMAEKRDQATANEKSWRLSAEAAESRLQERQSELHDVHTDLLEGRVPSTGSERSTATGNSRNRLGVRRH
jgi:hypothetical protein